MKNSKRTNNVKVNSEQSLHGFMAKASRLFAEHKHLRFSWRIGKDRSLDQNDMTFELYTRIGLELYGGDTELARRECKLTIGVPILREDDESFKESYDLVVRPHSYETKLKIMAWLPVSSLMGVRQCQRYIDKIIDTYILKGVPLQDFADSREKAA